MIRALQEADMHNDHLTVKGPAHFFLILILIHSFPPFSCFFFYHRYHYWSILMNSPLFVKPKQELYSFFTFVFLQSDIHHPADSTGTDKMYHLKTDTFRPHPDLLHSNSNRILHHTHNSHSFHSLSVLPSFFPLFSYVCSRNLLST